METVEIICEVIKNLGFPIACCVAMFVLFAKERNDHRQEVEKLTEAVNNNTTMMQRILDKLGGGTSGHI